MAFHLLDYNASVTNGVTNFDTAAITDGYASLQNGHYLLPKSLWTLFAGAYGANITRARLNAPTLRQVVLPQIQPLNVSLAPVTTTPLAIYPGGSFLIQAVDELAAELTNGGGAAEREHLLLGVGDRNFNVPQGQQFTLRATGTITAVSNTWTNGTFTLDAGLPAGRYSIVGASFVGANLLAARFVPIDGGMRPGAVAQATDAIIPSPIFRSGRLGEWLQFEHTAMPTLDIMATGANTAQTIYIDVVKVR